MWRSSPRWRVCRCEEVGVGVEDDIVVDDANVVLVVVDADLVVNVVDVYADVVDGDVVDGEVLPRPFPSGVNQFKHARLSPRHRDTLSAKSCCHKYLLYSHWC